MATPMRQVLALAGGFIAGLMLVSAAGATYASQGSVRAKHATATPGWRMAALGDSSATGRDLWAYRAPGRIVELAGNSTTVAALVNSNRLGCLVVRWRPGHLADLKTAMLFEDRAPAPKDRREDCGVRDVQATHPWTYGLQFHVDAISWSSFVCGNDCYDEGATWSGKHVRWTESDLGNGADVQIPRHRRPNLRRLLKLTHGRVQLELSTNTLVYTKR
jgi:hypothetical protein